MEAKQNSARPNILVVDDTPDNLRLLNNILTEQGYQVRPVSKGSRAISAAQSKPPDLILLDIMMPGMDGYTVCEALKADERTCDIPVIFISALNETFDKVKAFSLGGVDFITKPFQPEEVFARVKTHVTLRNAQKRLQVHNRELALLNKMSHRFQACQTEQETYQVVIETCQSLIPESSGYLYLCDEMQTILQSVASWNTPPPEFQDVSVESLEPGVPDTIDIVEYPDIGSITSRICYSPEKQALCIPINSSDTLLAMLGFCFESERAWTELIEEKRVVLTEIAEHYALALINLRLRETLRHEAIHDPLTGLYNRRHMEAALEREIHRAKRRETSVGIFMCDVDHFKRFNDTHGHEAGDVVLQELAQLIQKHIRGEDIACRYGGEEFLLIFPDSTLEVMEKRAQELLLKVCAYEIPYQNMRFHITVSIGVAVYPAHGSNVKEIVSVADSALYQAKEKGRNQVIISH